MSFDFDLTAPFIPNFSTKDQHEHRHKVQPVQILAPSTSHPGKFRLNESALNTVLGHNSIANRKVVIISVAGAFRKGKSFLLNFFLEYLYALQQAQQNEVCLEWLTDDCQLHGFHWRAGAKRDTAGIWMWGEPIMIEAGNGENYAVVLGTFDNVSTYMQCTTIFALSTIVSSVQIYNLVDNIQEDALQHLSLFVEYGRLALKEAQQFGYPFQKLVFCVRDFKAPEDFPYGKDGGTELLDQVMATSAEQPEELKTVREQIHACFESIQCFLLPHPGYRVAERASFRGHVKDLRPVFREEVRKMVIALLDPHIVNGKPATCKKMIQIFKEYAATFDGGTLPEARSILNANARILCMEACQEAKLAYCRGMDRIGAADVRSKMLGRLQEDINAELERYKRLNEAKRVTGCASAMTACGDSPLLGVGLGAMAGGAIAGAVITFQAGLVSTGIIAIPIALSTLFGIWVYVYVKPLLSKCFQGRSAESDAQEHHNR